MPWIKKEYDCGNCIMVVKCFASRYGNKGQVLRITDGNNKTSSIQQAVNDRNAMLRYSVLANANFKKGDYFITYTFKRGLKLPTKAECKAIWAKYRRKLRDFYKKQGKEFKYIYVFEYDGVRPHFHILFNNDGVNLADLPKWEYGTPHIETLDDREFHTIGEYFVKVCYDESEQRRKGDVGSSRNLYRPDPKITRLCSPSWSKTPKARAGYYIDTDSVVNGYTRVIENGFIFRYQSYRMIKQQC